MAELNLSQIEKKLNSEFESNERVIIFWYDGRKDFVEDIEKFNLENVKIHYLNRTNEFETKILLEIEDRESNYLVYAPFHKPSNEKNHLADTILYSKEFSADKITLIMSDLKIDSKYRYVFERHTNFFNSKERINRFSSLDIDDYNQEEILEGAMLASITRLRRVNFEEVLRVILSEDLQENKYMEEFKKYNLESVFWKHIGHLFGYSDEEPTLTKFVISLFITYLNNYLSKDLPKIYESYILNKPGNVMAFLDSMKHSSVYKEDFRRKSLEVYKIIDGDKILQDLDMEDLIKVDIFKEIDDIIIKWIYKNLMSQNLNLELKGMDIPEICKNRKFKQYNDIYSDIYNMFIYGYYILSNSEISIPEDSFTILDRYDKEYYKIDYSYRKFYYYLDRVKSNYDLTPLETLVENIYINKYLNRISTKFNKNLEYKELSQKYLMQKDFYNNFVVDSKERIVVIISDAFRYEIGKELVERFDYNEKIEASIEPQISVLPSYTSLGMAALLPHEEIEFDENYQVFVDKKATVSLKDRRSILKTENENSEAIQYDDLVNMNKAEMRDIFVGKEVIYVYHNQIDARGDAFSTENEVFIACEEAMEEIEDIIRRLTNNISATNFIITADHGFIYTRSKNRESEKIDRFFDKEDKINRRFIISENQYEEVGINNFIVSDVLGNYDTRKITTPTSSNIFKTQGGGQNFYHGGSSPQEIIVPLIRVKSIRGAVDIDYVNIGLISSIKRITTTDFKTEFVQKEPVSDIMKSAHYKVRFVDGDNNLISNEEIYLVKSRSEDSVDRIFSLNFKLKHQDYNDGEYYFLVTNNETGIDIIREKVIIDIPFL